jgi:integrase
MMDLNDALDFYLTLRRALGTELQEPAQALAHFLAFMSAENAEVITADIALRWATAPANVQTATWARRLSAVRGFAQWLSTIDSRTEIPPVGLIRGAKRRPRPHIFADSEIEHLMAEASRLPSRLGLRALSYNALIGLLASTGLRPGEVLALDLTDVDLDSGILSVRMTKFGKSRFVPLHDSVLAALSKYLCLRDQILPVRCNPAFLVSERGARISHSAAMRTFVKLLRGIGLRPPAVDQRHGRGPRLQDLRHTFATRKLIEWYQAGDDVDRKLPSLSTYLGHTSVEHTYWYIQAVPELLELAADRLRDTSAGGTP